MVNAPVISANEMRSLVLEGLRLISVSDFRSFEFTVAELAVEQGLLPRVYQNSRERFPEQLWGRYRDAVWNCFTEGLLAPGNNQGNPGFQWFGVTEYGRDYLAGEAPSVHDTLGFIRELDLVRATDPVERRFLDQAVGAYQRNLPDASAVMLGCASEHLILELARAVIKADAAAASATENKMKGQINKLVEHLQGKLASMSLPPELEKRRIRYFDNVAHVIRETRNEAGHPTDVRVDRGDCLANFALYRRYRRWIIETIDFLGTLVATPQVP